MDKIRWGILSTGGIANTFTAALRDLDDAEVLAVASSQGLPLVIKPADSAGSRGVSLIEREQDLVGPVALATAGIIDRGGDAC